MMRKGTVPACRFDPRSDLAVPGCHPAVTDPHTVDGSIDRVPVDTNPGVDACAQAVVTMHDTYAQALSLDGGNGRLTGVIAALAAASASCSRRPVEDHAHMLFIDPIDESDRVPGAPDVDVPLGCAS